MRSENRLTWHNLVSLLLVNTGNHTINTILYGQITKSLFGFGLTAVLYWIRTNCVPFSHWWIFYSLPFTRNVNMILIFHCWRWGPTQQTHYGDKPQRPTGCFYSFLHDWINQNQPGPGMDSGSINTKWTCTADKKHRVVPKRHVSIESTFPPFQDHTKPKHTQTLPLWPVNTHSIDKFLAILLKVKQKRSPTPHGFTMFPTCYNRI